jgi:uncharacterized secreted repeat protein (TIGR03808 family)
MNRRQLLTSTLAMPFVATSARAAKVVASGKNQTKALQRAIQESANGVVELGAGTFIVDPLTINSDIVIQGVPGLTRLQSTGGGEILSLQSAKSIVVQGVGFATEGPTGNLLAAEGIASLRIENCMFDGGEAGVRLAGTAGEVSGNQFSKQQSVGCFSIDGAGIRISGNTITDMSNAGIQVFRSTLAEDGTIITDNRISRVAHKAGGTGEYGNGINVFRAGNVIVANNRITDCAFTAIRNNSGSNSIITGNSISRCGEVALFVEFEYQGAVVSNNLVDTASHGIYIANMDVGGRLVQCSGNVVRNISGVDPIGNGAGGGIRVEADTVVSHNVIEETGTFGIGMGWGPLARNITVSNNLLRNCKRGIYFSAVAKGPFLISQNTIVGSSNGAIVGMDHTNDVTPDLAVAGTTPPEIATITGNIVRS